MAKHDTNDTFTVQIDIQNGTYRVWPTPTAAARGLQLAGLAKDVSHLRGLVSNIVRVCEGHSETAYGFGWVSLPASEGLNPDDLHSLARKMQLIREISRTPWASLPDNKLTAIREIIRQ